MEGRETPSLLQPGAGEGSQPSDPLKTAVDSFDLTLLETENLIINGFKSAFLSEKAKGAMIHEALKTFAALRDKFGLDERKVGP